MHKFDVLKDIEKKLGLEYKHKYVVEPYDKKDSTTKFILIYKGVMGFGARALLASNDLDDGVHSLETAKEYLESLPKYKGKLKILVQKRKLDDYYWRLLWVDYWTNIDGNESKIREMINDSDLPKEDKEELLKMILQKENKELAGYIPGGNLSVLSEISAGAFRELSQEEIDSLNAYIEQVAKKLTEKTK